MNEIKRQLNKNMGDTKGRAETVMAKVEQKKRQVSVKKKSNIPYYTAMVILAAAIASFFIFGPFGNMNDPTSTIGPITQEPEETNKQEDSYFDQLKRYFKKDGDIAYFIGEGSEYASYKETTKWLSDEYVEIIVDNGGSIMRTIYHITDDAIVVVYEDMTDGGYTIVPIEKLKTMSPISTILKAPIETGKKVNDGTITYPTTIKTLVGTFENAVLVSTENDGYILNRFYVEDMGLVMVTQLSEDSYAFTTTSLASINKLPADNSNEYITVNNTVTAQKEFFKLSELLFLSSMYPVSATLGDFKIEYTPIIKLSSSESELGVFSYDCSDLGCGLAFVIKNGEQIENLLTTWGVYGELKLSPTKEIGMIHITSFEEEIVYRDSLFLINLETGKMVVPNQALDYFQGQMWPIVEASWVGNQTIKLVVADVEDHFHETLLAWQLKKPLATKEIIFELQ